MPLVAATKIIQGQNCDRFVIEDISNYSEAGEPQSGFSQRKLIIYKADGTVYRAVEQLADEIDFSFASYPTNQITIDGLTQDLAFHVVMTLTPDTPVSGSIYTVSHKFALVCFTKGYLVERVKKMQNNRRYEENPNFVMDTSRISIVTTSAAIMAAGDDLNSAQTELDRAREVYINNPLPY
jgi:hypothetical protein